MWAGSGGGAGEAGDEGGVGGEREVVASRGGGEPAAAPGPLFEAGAVARDAAGVGAEVGEEGLVVEVDAEGDAADVAELVGEGGELARVCFEDAADVEVEALTQEAEGGVPDQLLEHDGREGAATVHSGAA